MTVVGLDMGNKTSVLYQLNKGNPQIIYNELGERYFKTYLASKNKKRYISFEIDNNLNSLYKTIIFNQVDEIFLNLNNHLDTNNIYKNNLHRCIIFINYIKQYLIKYTKTEDICLVINYSSIYANNFREHFLYLLSKLNFRKIFIIDDILSLAINYGYSKIVKQKIIKTEYNLIIDLGEVNVKSGICEVDKNHIYIKDKYFIKHLGGYDITQFIIKHIKKHIFNKYKLDKNQLQLINGYLLTTAETIKKNIFLINNYRYKDVTNINDKNIELDISLNKDILIDYFKLHWYVKLENMFHYYKKYINQVNNLILVGNTSRIKPISNFIRNNLPSHINNITNISIDESVSQGNCIYGGLKILQKRNIIVKDVIMSSISFKYKTSTFDLFKKGDLYPLSKYIILKKWDPHLQIFIKEDDNYRLLINTDIPKQNINNKKLKIKVHIDENLFCEILKISIDNKHIHFKKINIISNKIDDLVKYEDMYNKTLNKKKDLLELNNELESIYYKLIKLQNNDIICQQIKLKINDTFDNNNLEILNKKYKEIKDLLKLSKDKLKELTILN